MCSCFVSSTKVWQEASSKLPSVQPHPVCSDDWLYCAVCLLSHGDVGGDSWQGGTSTPVLQQAQLERRGHAGYKVVIKEKWGADSVPCHETRAGGQWIACHPPACPHNKPYLRHRWLDLGETWGNDALHVTICFLHCENDTDLTKGVHVQVKPKQCIVMVWLRCCSVPLLCQDRAQNIALKSIKCLRKCVFILPQMFTSVSRL